MPRPGRTTLAGVDVAGEDTTLPSRGDDGDRDPLTGEEVGCR